MSTTTNPLPSSSSIETLSSSASMSDILSSLSDILSPSTTSSSTISNVVSSSSTTTSFTTIPSSTSVSTSYTSTASKSSSPPTSSITDTDKLSSSGTLPARNTPSTFSPQPQNSGYDSQTTATPLAQSAPLSSPSLVAILTTTDSNGQVATVYSTYWVSPTSLSSETTSSSSSGSRVGAITGGVIGGLLGALLLVGLGLVFYRRSRRQPAFDGNFDPARVSIVGSPSVSPTRELMMRETPTGDCPRLHHAMGSRTTSGWSFGQATV